MATQTAVPTAHPDLQNEIAEWIEAFDEMIVAEGPQQGADLMSALRQRAREAGVQAENELATPYRNTIPKHDEVPYPGDRDLEKRVESLIRWNAMAMVHGQNKKDAGIGGHISTYSSLATLLEVGFNHFFHASYGDQPGDFIYFQGHASPGVYARAYLEGRLDDDRLANFRHELRGKPGSQQLSAPVADAGLLEVSHRSHGHRPAERHLPGALHALPREPQADPRNDRRKVWAFVGDGETDEVDTLGAIGLAARENLDNLIFVVNCNLQRLDGPVRGNKRIIDELEGVFRGAGWNVIKVIWGSDWDALFERDHTGLLLKRMEECVDGDFQAYKAKGGAYLRQGVLRQVPGAAGAGQGHDRRAARAAASRRPRPAEDLQRLQARHRAQGRTDRHPRQDRQRLRAWLDAGRNATHSEKKLTDEGVAAFVKRFDIPLPEEAAKDGAFYSQRRSRRRCSTCRRGAGRWAATCRTREVPQRFEARRTRASSRSGLGGSKGRAVSTTMGFVAILRALLKDPKIGKLIVPIVPDEGRTFGLESAIKQVGIYAREGQKYTPHDADMLLSYREKATGRSSRKASRRPAPWPLSPLPARPTRTTACHRFPSTCTTPCSAFSASATWCGRSRTRAARAS